MLHLFKKVYLDVDDRINLEYDRAVVSQHLGYQMLEELTRVVKGKLVKFGKNVDEVGGLHQLMADLNEHVVENNKTTVIYADYASFTEIIAGWLKAALPHASIDDAYAFVKSYLFKDRMFGAARTSPSSKIVDFQIDRPAFVAAYESFVVTDELKAFVSEIKESLSIEFMLASYLKDGTHRLPLKNAMTALVRKDLEKYLYELKEIVCVHVLRPTLQERLHTTRAYDFPILEEFIKDQSPMVQVFFKPEIWTDIGMNRASSNGTINFDAITDEDIELFRAFTEIAGSEWEEENYYRFSKSDIIKLDFIPFLRDEVLSNASLAAILDFEMNVNHDEGSFYSIDVSTVNNYFMDYILAAAKAGELDKLTPYTLD